MTEAAPDLAYYERNWLARGEWEPHIAKMLAREDWKSDMIEWQAEEIGRLRADLQMLDRAGARVKDSKIGRIVEIEQFAG